MTSAARLAAFAVGLAAAFAASFGIGAAIGPEPQADPEPAHEESPNGHDDMDHVRGGSSGGWAP